MGFPGVLVVKNSSADAGDAVQSLGWEDPLEKEMATPVFLPGKSHGERSLVGYSPWGHNETDMTERSSMRMRVVNKVNFAFS